MSQLLANLNPEQLAAVTLPNQSALILAGAGSGKTRVLTTRIAWLIQTGEALPSDILGVTFTNKAAKQMLTRLSVLLPINLRGMWVGTFHGLCNRLLRAHHREAGLPQLFQILDSQDQLAAIKRLLKALNVDDEKFAPRNVQFFINSNKEAGLRARAVDTANDFDLRAVELYQAYDEQCQREGVLDFAELLLRCYELLDRNELLREHYQLRFRHILVDEFQDTNRLQYRWLKLLAGPRAAMFAVGDDDQSIYAFRGANVGNMHAFERDFGVSQVIRLEQNYRSYGNILDAANALIRNNSNRLGKNLWTDVGHGEPITVVQAESDLDEAQFIVQEIRSLIADGLARSEIALLYRSNAQSRVLEHALFSAGLAYRVYGGLRFFERQEIKHALAYLRLAANRDDDGAFLRVVNTPPRGIGARTLEQLQELAKAGNTSLVQAATHLTGKPRTSVDVFLRIVDALRSASTSLSLPELVEQSLQASGLQHFYENEREGADRLENLRELINAASAFTHEAAEESGLAAFLAHASLEAGDNQAADGTDALQLMTVHAAKGLEFNAVFMSGLEEGLFPHENSVSNDTGGASRGGVDVRGLEEERRLMYVAITRARQRLYLSFAQTRMLHGQTRYSLASRFIAEIPENLLRWVKRRRAPSMQEPRPTTRYGAQSGGYATGMPPPARPQPIAASGTLRNGLSIGQTVSHPKFGHGVIVNAEGSGGDARVQVNFRDVGVKWLMLDVAKLSPA